MPLLSYIKLRSSSSGYCRQHLLLLFGSALPVFIFITILSLVGCTSTQEPTISGPIATLLATPVASVTPSPKSSTTPTTTADLEETRLAEQCPTIETVEYQNDVIGAALTYSVEYELLEDEYLADEYGFTVIGAGRKPVLRISWLHQAAPEQQEQLVEEVIQQFSDLPVEQTPVEVDGRPGVMLAPVPGEVANTVIYLSASERLYNIRYFKDTLDDLGRCLLGGVHFYLATQSLEDLQLTPASDALYPLPETETAIAQTEIVAGVTVAAQATAETGTPELPVGSTPISLAAVSSEWLPYDFPDLGISLSMPSDWEMLRYPGGYFFAPIDTLPVELMVGFKGNTPAELATMTEALTAELQDLTPFDFYTTPITVASLEGTAFWDLSPNNCVDIYVPAHSVVRQISFSSTFCNEARDQLNEVGQRILDSIAFYPPTN